MLGARRDGARLRRAPPACAPRTRPAPAPPSPAASCRTGPEAPAPPARSVAAVAGRRPGDGKVETPVGNTRQGFVIVFEPSGTPIIHLDCRLRVALLGVLWYTSDSRNYGGTLLASRVSSTPSHEGSRFQTFEIKEQIHGDPDRLASAAYRRRAARQGAAGTPPGQAKDRRRPSSRWNLQSVLFWHTLSTEQLSSQANQYCKASPSPSLHLWLYLGAECTVHVGRLIRRTVKEPMG